MLLASCASFTDAFTGGVSYDGSLSLEEKLEYYGAEYVSVPYPETFFDGTKWLERITGLIDSAEDYILISTFLGTDDISGTYTYTAKLLGIPETDAKLHVIIGLLSAMDPWSRDLCGINLHREELEEHLDALEGYAQLYAWVTQTVEKTTPQQTLAPWQQNTPMAYNQQPQLVPATASVGAPSTPTMLVPSSSIDINGNVMYTNSYAQGAASPLVSAASGPLGVPTYPVGSFTL